MTDIRMDWSHGGAVVSFTSNTIPSMNCPRCGATVESGKEHRCGDKAPIACEWNPALGVSAVNPPRFDDCRNPATVSLGAGKWHLCESCAKLAHFKRYRRRVSL